MNQAPAPRFYFALPRLLAKWRGGNSARAEENATEAFAGSIGVFAVSFLFFASFLPTSLEAWTRLCLFIPLTFAVWLFWLLVLSVNSGVIKLVRALGLFRSLPDRHAQSVLISAIATAMAFVLVQRGSWVGEIAALWIVAVALNLVAGAILLLGNGTHAGA
jgi:hypothetical protein